MTTLAVLLALLALALCVLFASTRASFTDGPDGQVKAAVINGTLDSQYWKHQYLVVLNGGQCMGMLIAPNVVLTAGHCVDSVLGTNVLIGFAPPSLKITSKAMALLYYDARKVVRVVRHPKYASVPGENHVYDIALLFLDAPSKKPTIRLASTLPPDGHNMTLVGRGLTNKYTPDNVSVGPVTIPYGTTMVAQLQYTSPKRTHDLLLQNPQIDPDFQTVLQIAQNPTLFCGTSSTGKSGCNGDSGGPLLVTDSQGNDTLLGVVSNGPAGCNYKATTTSFSFFSSVPYFTEWIRSVAHV